MDKNKKIVLYISLLLVSIILFTLVFIYNIDGIFGFIIFLSSIYLFIGSIIKLCKTSKKFKNSAIALLDILFYLP